MRPATVLLALIAAVGLGGCAVSGLNFRVDERIQIVEPATGDKVSPPVEVRWQSDIERTADGGPYYAVFVDREPIRPGENLTAVADESCRRTPGCPDLQYLRDRFVFVTEEQSVTLDQLPARDPGQRTGARDRYEAIIILLDANGFRLGESAWRVEFVADDD